MSGNLSGAWAQHNHALGEKKFFAKRSWKKLRMTRPCTATKSVRKLLTQEKLEAREGMGTTILYWHYGCSYNILIDCFHFLEISINQNWQGFYFQESFCKTSSLTYLIQHKKCGNRCEFRDWSRASVPLLKIRSDCFRSRCLDKFKIAYNEL